MPDDPPTMSVSTNLQEPPDISVLKDRSRLDYYITALKRWSGLAKATGTQDVFHADIVLDRAFRTYPELYMEMSDNFSDTLKDDGEGIQKIIALLNNKFEKSYADVKKTGESLSSSCRAILLLRQADL